MCFATALVDISFVLQKARNSGIVCSQIPNLLVTGIPEVGTASRPVVVVTSKTWFPSSFLTNAMFVIMLYPMNEAAGVVPAAIVVDSGCC